MAKSDLDKVLVVKGRFKAITTNTYGLFIIFYNKYTHQADNIAIIGSHFSEMFENDHHMPWHEFDETLKMLRYRGKIAANISNDLQLMITNALSLEVNEEIVDSIAKGRSSRIENIFMTLLQKSLSDNNIVVETVAEEITQEDIRQQQDVKARKEREEQKEKEKEVIRSQETASFQVEEGGVILNCHFVISPVSGIPIDDLSPGAMIMIKIIDPTERGKYFIDLLQARTPEGELKGIGSVVKETRPNSLGETEVLVEIGPGIYGKIIESEKVKIKRYNPEENPQPKIPAQGAQAAPAGMDLAAASAKYTQQKGAQAPVWIWIALPALILIVILIIVLMQ